MKKTAATIAVGASAVFSYLIMTANLDKTSINQDNESTSETNIETNDYEIKDNFKAKSDFQNLKLVQIENEDGDKNWYLAERQQKDTEKQTSFIYIDALQGDLLSIDTITEEKHLFDSSTYTHAYSYGKVSTEKMALPEVIENLGKKDTYQAEEMQKMLDKLNGKTKETNKTKTKKTSK